MLKRNKFTVKPDEERIRSRAMSANAISEPIFDKIACKNINRALVIWAVSYFFVDS
jgi:hypothetical protein